MADPVTGQQDAAIGVECVKLRELSPGDRMWDGDGEWLAVEGVHTHEGSTYLDARGERGEYVGIQDELVLRRVLPQQGEPDEGLREALQELVDLKDLKERDPDGYAFADKEAAWAKARAALRAACEGRPDEADTIKRYACKVCGNWRGGGIGGESETCKDHWEDVTPRIPLRFVLDERSRVRVAALRVAREKGNQ